MRISIIVEGATETVFKPHLREYLEGHLAGRMPSLDFVPIGGRVPTGEELRRLVCGLLRNRPKPADHVIALTDVYTGTVPPIFHDAADAKRKMRLWVGEEPRFHPHAAQHDFEAWLLPHWKTIQQLAGHNQAAPGGNPEAVNHNNPPAHRIMAVFERGRCRDSYVKPRDAGHILRANGLSASVRACPELKAFMNTILSVCGGEPLP